VARQVHRIGVQHRYQDQQAERSELAREKVTFTRSIFALLVSIEPAYRQGKIQCRREGAYLTKLAVDGLDQLGTPGFTAALSRSDCRSLLA
jgi:hypothetical protein